MGMPFVFTAEVNVFDKKALMRAAREHGRASGMGSRYRPGSIQEALKMVMDGGPEGKAPCDMGFEIQHSGVESV